MYILYLLLFIIYHTFFSVLAVKKINRLKYSYISENTRIKYYLETAAENLIPALAVLAICLFSSTSLHDIGLRKIEFKYNIWLNIIIISLSVCLSAYLLFRIISEKLSEKYRYWAKRRYSPAFLFSHYNDTMYYLIIPHKKKEILIYSCFSIIIGICKEIVLRGFFYFLLLSIFSNIPIVIILFLSSFAFGFLHTNMGVIGVVKTMLNSALLGCLYFATGCIFPGMVLHFLIYFADAFVFSE